MKIVKVLLLINLLLGITALHAQGRAPAVEDFVGVETQDYTPAPEGTEFFFNFDHNQVEQAQIDSAPIEASHKQQIPFEFPIIITFAVIALPFIMWFGIQHSMRHIPETKSENEVADSNLNNVEFLEMYQKEKQKVDSVSEHDESLDDEKKAS